VAQSNWILSKWHQEVDLMSLLKALVPGELLDLLSYISQCDAWIVVEVKLMVLCPKHGNEMATDSVAFRSVESGGSHTFCNTHKSGNDR
jgi:hypothetical protein